ncbi:diguanylate cyclase domain-containing protein [Neoaquamicrobium microcysteis]|uniref:diguanylate cyclase domain-containing protein n=1 Tax=Neoaquamicrobium microcysteis TaxID=2682781 RepID=UPI001F3B637F|nr:GGDEF domain-containing protein [Mesorhizobium microcysteis]
MLIKFALLLRDVCRPTDTIARIGGDEFAVLVEGIDSKAEVLVTAWRILDALKPGCDFGGEPLKVGASIGVAIAPFDGLSADQLFETADRALYEAKATGGSSVRMYDTRPDQYGTEGYQKAGRPSDLAGSIEGPRKSA